MVVDDFPTGWGFPNHQRKPPRRVASTRDGSFQVVLPGSQDQARRKRPCFDLRKSQRPHCIAIWIAAAITVQNGFGSTSYNLAADESGFRSVLVIRYERHQVTAV